MMKWPFDIARSFATARPFDIGGPFEKERSFDIPRSGVAMAFLEGNVMGCNTLCSITTAWDVRNDLATEAECSIQHLTTCTNFQDDMTELVIVC